MSTQNITSSRNLQAAIAQMRGALEELSPDVTMSIEDSQMLDDLLPMLAKALPNHSINIVITGDRARRFHWAVGDMTDLNVSLKSTASAFPSHCGLEPGQIHHTIAVEVFSAGMEKRLDLIQAMLANEEKPEEK